MTGAEFYFFDPILDPKKVISNYLFGRSEHLRLQAKRDWKVFGLTIEGKTVLQMAFHIKSGIAESPRKAPFGSLQITGRITKQNLDYFLSQIEFYLKETAGCKKIIIKNFPEGYHVAVTRLLYTNFVSTGFKVKEEVSSIITVDKAGFKTKIVTSKKQKLKKCEARFEFVQLPLTRLASLYRFIETCRHKKKYALSMSLRALRSVVSTFKNDFYLFGATENRSMVAAAIVIRVNQEILYTFYYAHDSRFDKISPTVFLLSGIYSFAQTHKYKIIDLGTSMNGSEINKPLLHFKKSVGAIPSPKYRFEKYIA